MNPIENILKEQKLFIIDGALGTYLEEKGYDIKDALWSAKFLQEKPSAIKEIHKEYLEAGADCIITASYQASFEGFMKRGLNEEEAKKLIQSSIYIAKEARDEFWQDVKDKSKRCKPLVAASIGPYGALLADGSEYTGKYPIGDDELYSFHKKRLETILQTQPDILACETLPILKEAKILSLILKELGSPPAWISFSAKDDSHISAKESIQECAKWLSTQKHIGTMGINCTATEYITPLVNKIQKYWDKPIIIYPNFSAYVPSTKTWEGIKGKQDFAKLAFHWWEQGVKGVGGCCQTNPQHIQELSNWVRKI